MKILFYSAVPQRMENSFKAFKAHLDHMSLLNNQLAKDVAAVLPDYDLVILSLLQLHLAPVASVLVASLQAKPTQRLIVIGQERLPGEFASVAEHQAQPLTWRALGDDSSAIKRLYETMLARTPVSA